MKMFIEDKVVNNGTYQHYKGQLYRVHGVVRHSETLEHLVLYEALYENEQGQFWVRPKKMFLEYVDEKTPRFRFLGGDKAPTTQK